MVTLQSDAQAEQVMQLCFGRILKMASRPFEEGDIEKYEECKWLFMDAAESLGLQTQFVDTTSFAANYDKIYHD